MGGHQIAQISAKNTHLLAKEGSNIFEDLEVSFD